MGAGAWCWRQVGAVGLLICLTALCVLGTPTACGARNPFVKSPESPSNGAVATVDDANATGDADRPEGLAAPAWVREQFTPVMRFLAQTQLRLRSHLVAFGQAMRENPYGRAFWLFLGAAFLYGMAHAAGPGHGKVFACAYFASRPARLVEAGLFSAVAMVSHVLSATALVLGGAFVLRMSGALAVEQYGAWLETASYALLALVGLVFTAHAVRELARGARRDDRAATCPEAHTPARGSRRGLLATASAVGIAPCPGAAIVLVFALTQGLLTQGLAAMAAIAAGMSVTTTAAACATLYARRGFSAMLQGRERLMRRSHGVLALLGSLTLFLFGALLLLGRVG